jgi:hypothetical protein
MAGRAAGLIVVIDASTFVSAAPKANSLPNRALLRAVDPKQSPMRSRSSPANPFSFTGNLDPAPIFRHQVEQHVAVD